MKALCTHQLTKFSEGKKYIYIFTESVTFFDQVIIIKFQLSIKLSNDFVILIGSKYFLKIVCYQQNLYQIEKGTKLRTYIGRRNCKSL